MYPLLSQEAVRYKNGVSCCRGAFPTSIIVRWSPKIPWARNIRDIHGWRFPPRTSFARDSDARVDSSGTLDTYKTSVSVLDSVVPDAVGLESVGLESVVLESVVLQLGAPYGNAFPYDELVGNAHSRYPPPLPCPYFVWRTTLPAQPSSYFRLLAPVYPLHTPAYFRHP